MSRAIEKLIIGRFRYGAGQSYNAESYWRDRFAKHGGSLRGPGHEGLSVEDNAALNTLAGDALMQLLLTFTHDLSTCSVLDIGSGAGFATGICSEAGIQRYTGLDITDVLFPTLKRLYSSYAFEKGDITKIRLQTRYDIVLMLEVLEHVVERVGLASALGNAATAVAPDGMLVIALHTKKGSPRRFFYLRFWDLEEIKSRLPGFVVVEAVPWRFGKLIVFRRAL